MEYLTGKISARNRFYVPEGARAPFEVQKNAHVNAIYGEGKILFVPRGLEYLLVEFVYPESGITARAACLSQTSCDVQGGTLFTDRSYIRSVGQNHTREKHEIVLANIYDHWKLNSSKKNVNVVAFPNGIAVSPLNGPYAPSDLEAETKAFLPVQAFKERTWAEDVTAFSIDDYRRAYREWQTENGQAIINGVTQTGRITRLIRTNTLTEVEEKVRRRVVHDALSRSLELE